MQIIPRIRFTGDDFKASLAVFLIAVPLCLGIALASGAPASSGLIAGIIGGFVIGFLSPSEISVSGPAAGLTVIVASGIEKLGAFEALCFATALAGVLQIVLGAIRFGYVGTLIPASVIKGMLAAIGIIIILKQIPHAFGYDADFFGNQSFAQADGDNTFSAILNHLDALSLSAVIISAVSAIVLLTWDRLATKVAPLKAVPAALVVVVLGILINEFALLPAGIGLIEDHLVRVPEGGGIFQPLDFSRFMDYLSMPHFQVAITLCLVGSLETLLSIDASEKIDPLKRSVDSSRELYAQGIGNTLSGLLGGLPITAVIVRTSANVSSGGIHRSAGIMHAVWLFVFALFFPALLNRIPLAALAMILIFVGFKLTTPKLYKSFLSKGVSQITPFLVTIIAILLTDLLMGVAIGFLVGIFFVIKDSVHSVFLMVQEGEHYLLRFNKDTSFLNKPQLKKALSTVPDNSEIVIDGSRPIHIDPDIIDVIEDFREAAPRRNITVQITQSSLAISPYFRSP